MGILAGKTVIITGGTSGMGEGIARRFSSEGCNVALMGRDHRKGEVIRAELGRKGSGVLFMAGDVADPGMNKLLVDQTMDRFGRLDLLVVSAGRLGLGRITDVTVDDWKSTVDVNLNAVFYILKYAIPAMNEHGGGNIVLIGSVAAFHAFPGHPAYCASKGALVSLVRQVAADYGPPIRINMLCPAQVDTPLLRDSVRAFKDPGSIIEETKNKLPLKRLGTPGDIAEAALFLAGDASSWITGTCLTIDGGFLCT